ncbi:signal peptide peptidase SppA [Alteraurantiacibacter buctensis]|uniref:Signal peptide peptidase SppA n=1 Tax=Alteraurantiacibacter buctensis TaxID=1503981 RepID=A0A844YY64_9SPHN|nr:signal peptide peptidase SppA [Alteraurantiacibacter buctensis]MXO73275.1 signal peptide peptidase SppA [Alteraurantiacibacter buctensis]
MQSTRGTNMSFAGKVWRLLVGIKDGLALCFFLLFFTLLFAALRAAPAPAQVRDGALLLELDGSLAEEVAPADPLEGLLSSAIPTRQYAARDLVRAIDDAATDERIKAIALDLTSFTGGPHVSVQEVAEALGRFRAADKPVLAFGVAYADDAVALAGHASEVWVDPLGGAAILGPGGSNLYFGEALQRYGVTAHIFKVGTFKSAVEPYSGSGMSEPARENATQYITAIWEEWQAHLRQARPQVKIDQATTGLVDLMAAQGSLARASLAAGLVDKIGTRDQWAARVAEVAGEDAWDDRPGTFASTDFDTYFANLEPENGSGLRSLTGGGSKAIGVITIAGEISDGSAGPGEAGAERIVGLLDDALNDDLAALVVRVDSPGGSVTGSEAIRRAIMRFKDKDIPIAVSMGNYAASGGYWVATPADRIFAQPETITGSIGVFSVIPTFETVLAEYGVRSDGVKTTPLSGQPDLLGGLTPEAQALLQAETAAIYDTFLGLVAQSRQITRARADELGQGRVWTGGTARQLGLVDQFGGLDDALAWAAAEADLAEGSWHAKYLVSPPDPWDEMIAGLVGGGTAPAGSGPDLVSVSGLMASRQQQALARAVGDMERLIARPGARVLCLECLATDASRPAPQAIAGGSWWQMLATRIFAH